MNIEQLKSTMISQAQERHSEIYPCGGLSSLSECFTVEADMLLFWFNTKDNSTHAMMEEM